MAPASSQYQHGVTRNSSDGIATVSDASERKESKKVK